MIEEYDVVQLTRNKEAIPVPIGTTGTILMIFNREPLSSYMIEFMDDRGNSMGTFIVAEDDIALVA